MNTASRLSFPVSTCSTIAKYLVVIMLISIAHRIAWPTECARSMEDPLDADADQSGASCADAYGQSVDRFRLRERKGQY